jgi:hypothetical protein
MPARGPAASASATNASADRAPAAAASGLARAATSRESWATGSLAGFVPALAFMALLLAAALLRASRWSNTALLFNDGPHFLALAESAAAGDFEALLRHPYHPLYPLAVAAVHELVPDWERAAVTVSVLSGTGAVAALFAFVRMTFGAREAWLAALLLALHPQAIEYCGDVQSEGLYLLLFTAGFAALFAAWQRGGPAWAAVAGACAGLAYLTRPEGIGIALLGGLLALERTLRRRWSVPRAAGWLAALATLTLLIAGPYLLGLRAEHGEWRLTGKKSLVQMLGAAPPGGSAIAAEEPAAAAAPDVPAADASAPGGTNGLRHAAEALAEVVQTGVRALRYELLALVVIGIVLSRRRIGERGAFVLALLALYASVLFALRLNVGYVSARHALPPLLASFGHAAAAAPVVGGLVLSWLRLDRGARQGRPLLVGSVVILALLGPGALEKAFVPDRLDDLAERRAAEWLRGQGLPPAAVAVRRERIAYYADAPSVEIPAGPTQDLSERLRGDGARYAIVRERDLRVWPQLGETTEVELLHRVEAAGVVAHVVRLREPPGP